MFVTTWHLWSPNLELTTITNWWIDPVVGEVQYSSRHSSAESTQTWGIACCNQEILEEFLGAAISGGFYPRHWLAGHNILVIINSSFPRRTCFFMAIESSRIEIGIVWSLRRGFFCHTLIVNKPEAQINWDYCGRRLTGAEALIHQERQRTSRPDWKSSFQDLLDLVLAVPETNR